MNTALLCIEIQKDHFPSGKNPLERSQEAAAKAQQALQAFRDKKRTIIHVQHISTQPDASFMLPCTKGAEFFETVQPLKNETIIKKHYPNSFKDTQLLNHLIKNQINHLLICGMSTHLSIDATVRAAHDLGFSCTVLHDACTAHSLEFNHNPISAQQVHHAFMAALQYGYAAITNTDDYVQKMNGRMANVA